MVRTYKVVYDRSLCIGAAACTTAAPDGWEIDKEDGKANLIGGEATGPETFEMTITEDQYAKFKDAEEVCPVAGCIKVVELKEDQV